MNFRTIMSVLPDTDTPVHPFEAAGLGIAPFRFQGIEDAEDQIERGRANGNDPLFGPTHKPGGSCAFCGTYIVVFNNFRSADGQKFHVGSDCAINVQDTWIEMNQGSFQARKEAEQVKAAKRKRARVARHKREARKLAELAELLVTQDVRRLLAAEPHPKKWRADKGETLLDSIQWYVDNAGTKGKLDCLYRIKKVIAA